MVGDSAAGRRCLWNNFVTSSRSPEVANSYLKGLEESGQLLEESGQLLKEAHSTLYN